MLDAVCLNATNPTLQGVDYATVLRHVCDKLHWSVGLISSMMLAYWVMEAVVVSRVRQWVDRDEQLASLKAGILLGLGLWVGMSRAFMVMGGLFLVYVSWTQGELGFASYALLGITGLLVITGLWLSYAEWRLRKT